MLLLVLLMMSLHGRHHCVLLLQVAYKYGVDTHNLLKEAGANITFKTYNGMGHSVSQQ